jgi:hypothetical protein
MFTFFAVICRQFFRDCNSWLNLSTSQHTIAVEYTEFYSIHIVNAVIVLSGVDDVN